MADIENRDKSLEAIDQKKPDQKLIEGAQRNKTEFASQLEGSGVMKNLKKLDVNPDPLYDQNGEPNRQPKNEREQRIAKEIFEAKLDGKPTGELIKQANTLVNSEPNKTSEQIQADYENGLKSNRLDRKISTPTTSQEASRNTAEAQGKQKENIAKAFNNPYNAEALKIALQNFSGNPVDTKLGDIASPDTIKKFNTIKNTQLRLDSSLADLKKIA